MSDLPSEEHPFADSDQVFAGEMPSRLEAREQMIQEALQSVEAAGGHPDPFFDRLFLDELISNAILHGNCEDPSKTIRVRAFRKKDCWGFEIADEGAGFAWGSFLEDLKKPLDQSKASGRGLALIISTGAGLHFLDGGRRVVIVRKD
jgi:serine/threonine-protein kinase RsbW